MNYINELQHAIDAAKKAGEIQLENRHLLSSIEKKSDRSPVTAIDRQCEKSIKEHLMREFPDDSFLGEETGIEQNKKNGRCWIVDPLDGTRPYIRNIPTYSVLISLEENMIPVLGVIYLPSMNILCQAARGCGAYLNGAPIHVSDTEALDNSIGSALGFIEKSNTQEGRQLFSLMHEWDYAYGFMDAYSYVCVASGRLDCTVNLLDKAWDCSAASCIISESGGTFSDIYGNRSAHNGSIVFSNGKLHQNILNYFK